MIGPGIAMPCAILPINRNFAFSQSCGACSQWFYFPGGIFDMAAAFRIPVRAASCNGSRDFHFAIGVIARRLHDSMQGQK